MDADKTAALETALERIEKDHGKGAVMRLGEISDRLATDAISTGSLTLDVALGIGGIPRSRVTEVFGAESGWQLSGASWACPMPQHPQGERSA